MGKLLAICTSPQRGTVKTEVESARLTPEWGIETDAHGGNWHRQVSLLSAEKIENFRKKIWVDYGAFGENLVVEGYDFRNLPVTSRFAKINQPPKNHRSFFFSYLSNNGFR